MLRAIRVFIKVAELGSFSRAAEVLNVAPSSVARNIDSLEHELETTLFKRSTRQLLLTDKGRIFLEGALNLVDNADLLKASMLNKNEEPEGILRISVFESFGRLHVCPHIPEFLQKYPKITIEIELENRVADLISENIDIGIRVGIPVDSSLKARNLVPIKNVICASPSYLAKRGYPKEPEDLRFHNCLSLNRDRQRTYWYFKKGRSSKKVHINGNLKSKGGTPLLEAALHGLGVIQLSAWVVSEYVNNGQLEVCLPDWHSSLSEVPSGQVYALYKQGHYPKPVIRLFIDHLVEKMGALHDVINK